MIPLYSEEEFISAKVNDKLPCRCIICNNIFYREKRVIYRSINKQKYYTNNYCSQKCFGINKNKKILVKCLNCNNEFEKQNSEISKSSKHFCCKSCAATYNNKHKTKGNRRSKLEAYLENELIKLYSDLEIHFNRKDAINSELDIYIPLLKLAFELNGLFHYEPIFGDNKLNQITDNDNRKFQACFEQGIELCIIDTSQQKYFKIETSQKYLNIIRDVINMRVVQ